MSLSTTFLKASEFLSLNACQADFSLASIAALSGVAAMETATVAKRATIVRVICFFTMSFRWGWVLKSACCIQAGGQANRGPVQIYLNAKLWWQPCRLRGNAGDTPAATVSRNNGSGF